VEDIVTGPRLSSCIYLRAVIDETMRMSPLGAAEGIREVLLGGIDVKGHYIEVGLNVGTAIYALHHDEEIFHDPFLFRPERWIVSESVSAKKRGRD
jgi:cytochrome P450